MRTRQAAISSMTCSTDSTTTTRFPVVRTIVVSGTASIVMTRSGLRWKGSSPFPSRWSSIIGQLLAVEVDQVLEHLVGRGDHARAGLEAALRGDHGRELRGEVDVRHLEGARRRGAEDATLAGGVDGLGAGVGARAPAVAGQALEAGLVRELGQREVAGDRAPAGDRRQHARLDVADGRDEAHGAVLRDGDVRGAGRDLDEAVGAAAGRGAAHDVVAV